MSKCIYCGYEKNNEEFNTEHVVPKMMGRYENAYTLSKCQVCEKCNSFFSVNIEDKLSMDSWEAFLRFSSDNVKISEGNKLRQTRTVFSINEPMFEGAEIAIVKTQTTGQGFGILFNKAIGICRDEESTQYDYYTLDTLPVCTPEKVELLKQAKKPIITIDYSKEESEKALRLKGYPIADFSGSNDIKTIYPKESFILSMVTQIDPLCKRLALKTIFNYLCYKLGQEFANKEIFNPIRRYIRYGEKVSDWKMKIIKGQPLYQKEYPNSISVGLIWDSPAKRELYGSVCWDNELEYLFKLCNNENLGINILPFSIFDNTTRRIVDFEEIFVLDK